MAFTVQDDDGNVTGANAYLSVAELDAYHADRGNTYTGSPDTTAKEQAIVKSTDYLDTRFRFVGQKRSSSQSTEWPRYDARDLAGNLISDIPEEVKEATAEYALRAIAGSLVADPSRDETGQGVKSTAVKADVVESKIEYIDGGSFTMPKYPVADRKLVKAGLTVSGGNLIRA